MHSRNLTLHIRKGTPPPSSEEDSPERGCDWSILKGFEECRRNDNGVDGSGVVFGKRVEARHETRSNVVALFSSVCSAIRLSGSAVRLHHTTPPPSSSPSSLPPLFSSSSFSVFISLFRFLAMLRPLPLLPPLPPPSPPPPSLPPLSLLLPSLPPPLRVCTIPVPSVRPSSYSHSFCGAPVVSGSSAR